jgi:predicted Zn-dependent protease
MASPAAAFSTRQQNRTSAAGDRHPALDGDPTSWLNHAVHDGALFHNGEHAKSVAALNEGIKLHGKQSLLTHGLLALAHLAMGDMDKAKDALAQAPLAKDAPWERSSCTVCAPLLPGVVGWMLWPSSTQITGKNVERIRQG